MTRTIRRRPVALTALLLLCVLALSACGAKLDTLLTINADSSGTRVITASLSQSDLEAVTGGASAIDASIAAHKPAEIDYSGIQPTADGVVATFTIAFASVEEYKTKVAAILAAGGSTDSPEVTIAIEDGVFLQGVTVDEGYTSSDLLKWLVNGLVADGAVSESDRGSMLENGATKAIVNGQEYDQWGASVRISEMRDLGMRAVQMRTTYVTDGSWLRDIDLVMDVDKYDAHPQEVDAYLKSATPEGAELTTLADPGYGRTGWSIAVPAASPKEIEKATNTILGTQNTVFAVDSKRDSDSSIGVITTITDFTECTAICSPRSSDIASTLVIPAGWNSSSTSMVDGGDGMVELTSSVSNAPLVFTHSLPVRSIDIATDLGLSGSAQVAFTVVVDTEVAAAADGGFEELLAVNPEAGTLATDEGDGVTRYTVTLDADDLDALSMQLADFLPGSFALSTDSGDVLRVDQNIEIYLNLESLVQGGGTEVSHSVTLPFSHTPSSAPGGTIEGNTITFTRGEYGGISASLVGVKGWTLTGVVMVGSLVILLLAMVVCGVVFRKQIGARLLTARTAAAARVADQGGTADLPDVMPGSPSGLPQPDYVSAGFTEHDLV